MAMQTAVSFLEMLSYAGAGYTGVILYENIKPSDVLKKLQGFSFFDLMCVTKLNIANAISSLTKYLEDVTEAPAVARGQKSLSDIDFDLRQLQSMVSSLDEKISSLEYKQELANFSLVYLCNFANGKKVKMPEALKELM